MKNANANANANANNNYNGYCIVYGMGASPAVRLREQRTILLLTGCFLVKKAKLLIAFLEYDNYYSRVGRMKSK